MKRKICIRLVHRFEGRFIWIAPSYIQSNTCETECMLYLKTNKIHVASVPWRIISSSCVGAISMGNQLFVVSFSR